MSAESSRRLGIKTKIVVSGVLLVFVSVLGLAWLLSLQIRDHTEKVIVEEQSAFVIHLVGQLDRQIGLHAQGLQLVAEGLSPGVLRDTLRLEALLQQRPVLRALFAQGVSVLNAEGMTVADWPVNAGRRGTSVASREWFQTVAATNAAVIGEPYIGGATKRPLFVMAAPIRDGAGRFAGALAGTVYLDEPSFVSDLTATPGTPNLNLVLISPKSGVFLAAPDAKRVMTAVVRPGVNRLHDRCMAGEDASMTTTNSRGIEQIASCRHLASTGWFLFAGLPTAIAFKPATEFQRNALILALVLATTAALLLALWARRLLTPLEEATREITARVDAEGARRFERLPLQAEDEVGRLVAGFNALIGRMAENEARLRESEQRFARVFRSGPIGICISRLEDGLLLDMNDAYLRIFGYAREEMLGRTVHELGLWGRPDQRAEVVALLREGGRVQNFEMKYRRKSGQVGDMLLSAELIELAGEHCFLAMVADIHALKAAEAEIRLLNEGLEKRVAERTAELERAKQDIESFSYSVSHDLRAPLRAINGFAHLLLESQDETVGPEGREHLNRILRNASKMGQLIEDILEFSRVGRAELRRLGVNMGHLAQAVVGELSDSYPKARVRIGPLPSAQGDEAMLKQVLANLVGNALKYSDKNERPVVDIGSRAQDGETAYFVKDNGVGFDMAYAKRLFGVFQRMHSDKEFVGTGVGLAIVKHIVERHGGRVWAEAAVGEGASFYFTLGRG